MDPQSFADLLNQVMEEKDISAYKISDIMGVGESTISNWRLAKNKKIPSRPTIEKLASILGVSADWLATGQGSKEPTVFEQKVIHPETVNSTHQEYTNSNGSKFFPLPNGKYFMTMPLADFKIQAGFLDHYNDAEFLMDMDQYGMVVDKPVQGRYVAFAVNGNSMDDGSIDSIPANSTVATRELSRVHWTSRLRLKDFKYWVIYTTQSRHPLIKEIIEHDTEEGYITCHSLNDGPDFNDFKLHMNDIQALFYVIKVTKDVSNKTTY